MATTNIDDNEPTGTGYLPELLVLLDKLLDMADKHQLSLAPSEYRLLNTLRFGTTTGSGTVTGIVVTY